MSFEAQLRAIKAQAEAIAASAESLLEQCAAGADEPHGCQHENAQDISAMGQTPGSTLYCCDCLQTIQR